MDIKELIPWRRTRGTRPVKWEEEHPFYSLRREMNRLFEDFFDRFELMPFRDYEEHIGAFHPCCDVIEGDKDIMVKAELPGMDEKDIDVSLTKDGLTIKGEKREEKEEKKKDYHRMERSYGSIHRFIPLPEEIDTKKVEAKFKNGILTITMPKVSEAKKKRKKIPIKTD